jgi:hypothetical protein
MKIVAIMLFSIIVAAAGIFAVKPAMVNFADYFIRQPILSLRDEIELVNERQGSGTASHSDASSPAQPSRSAKTWEIVNDNAPFDPRDGAFVASFNGYIWLTNGYNPGEIPNRMYRSRDGQKWEVAMEAVPWPRRHLGGFVVLRDRLFMIGGDFRTDVWSTSDGINWQQEPDVPWGKRYNPYIGVFHNKIWVMGGQTFDGTNGESCNKPYCLSRAFNDVWSSDDGKTWVRVTEHAAWEPRSLISGFAIHDNAMWIMGGGIREIVPFAPDGPLADTRIAYADVWRSTDGKNWENVTYRAEWPARSHVSVIGHGGYLIVQDGSIGKQSNLGSDTWASKDGKNWTQIAATGSIPRRHASSLVEHNGDLFLIAGLLHNDVWKLSAEALTEVGATQ